MHGIVLYGLKQFVLENYDQDAWDAILEEAGIPNKLFVPVTDYPDEYALDIVAAAAELTGEDPADLQYEFGRFVVPHLVKTYGVHVDVDWTGLELIENVETYIHEALRAKQLSEFTPPALGARRVDDDCVVVTYGSDRQLCALAEGLLVGVGEYYDETYELDHRQCMQDGASHCEIVVQQVA